MFEGLTEKLTGVFNVFGRGRLTEKNIRDGMQEVRKALLEADVSYDVAKDFVARVTEQAVGERVLKSVKPGEQIVYIVHQELVNLMGPEGTGLSLKRDGITVLMMCGLQGSGKTTTCGKLARKLVKAYGKKPMLVAADLQRPAAIEQLRVVGEQVGVPVHTEDPAKTNPVKVCQNGFKAAKQAGCDVVILDTAGRLHVDDELMSELRRIDNKLGPDQALLVVDAMTGQDAVQSAKAFNDALELDGVILTKLDGDTRGGAALSVKAVTGVPIKFAGTGEQLDALDEFRPEGMASRILGMGDVVSLVKKAEEELDAEEAALAQEKLLKGKFTLEDFANQMRQIQKLGKMKDVMKMIPGMGRLADMDPDMDPEADMRRIEGIINSMTPDERANPEQIDRSRRHRIAQGSGTEASEVNKLLKDFGNMAGMMQQMAGMGMRERMRAVKQMADGGMLDPGAELERKKLRSKRGPDKATIRDKRKQKRKDVRKQRKKNKR